MSWAKKLDMSRRAGLFQMLKLSKEKSPNNLRCRKQKYEISEKNAFTKILHKSQKF